ncbi:hypothetical protein [Rhodococcus qingshengii]|uniref:hypothetical protein n=1 Tax=Rhodococcus qingshengii TaxID=334542 RepID=UPI001A48DAF5|nr:hypothetical protein [Rhodococcus qingshengii]ULD38926.1 hypothetical protein JKI97_01110 [Rhodococcus qingshengii]
MSIVESFCTERLLVEMDAIIPSEDASIGSKAKRHVAVQKIWDDSHGRAIASWDILHKTYHAWLAVPKSIWKQIIELTDARNAVAHGHGQLTWKQKRGGLQEIENLRKRLATHEISLDGTQLVLTEQSVTHAAKLCRDFILELDEILRGKSAAKTASPPTS